MNVHPFLRPRLTGDRFEGHTIPLEFLKDLAVLNEMIVEVAKWEFLKANPDRKRSPRGFTEGIELKLTGIDDGSAILVISLVVAATTLFPPSSTTYFERAREAVVSAIRAAEQNQSITDYLPEKSLSYFDRMGRSLRDGESIEFTSPDCSTPARLTRETRRKLVLASSQVRELTEEYSVRGAVPEVDQEAMTFHVQLADGGKVRAPIAPQHLDTILEAFTSYKTRLRVLLQGIGRLDRNGRLLSFDSVEHVSILDPLDIPARLDELRLLKAGWLDGKGQAPSRKGLDWISEAFGAHYPEELPLPYLYPTAEGGIQAEWSVGAVEVSLEIDLETHTGKWHTVDMETHADGSREIDLDDASDWEWLVEQIQQMTGDVV